ncbi:hypothetical protein GCM10010278_37540 [Streptomyces melanogenes]|nr:hypothetical protein GCM10010278_37540 [Streptomyces melanogenes]
MLADGALAECPRVGEARAITTCAWLGIPALAGLGAGGGLPNLSDGAPVKNSPSPLCRGR